MKSYPVIKVAAFAEGAANLLSRNTVALLAAGYDAADAIAAFQAGAAALPVTDETQEHAKAHQSVQTDEVTAAAQAAYTTANNALNAAIGFLGKDTPEADEARRLRATVADPTSAPQVTVFIRSVVAYLTNHTAALVAKKYNPAAKITQLNALPATLTAEKGQQEQAKTERGGSTLQLNTNKDNLYTDVNNTLEAAIGLMGHNSLFADEARRLRAALYGRDNGPEEPPTPPPPPPTPPA